jgi:hypothetical protein
MGFRRALTAVRHHQILLARERAVLHDAELEISHQLADAVRDVDLNYGVAQTNFNRRVAAEDEVDAVETLYEVGQIVIDRVLDAQARQAEAESAYYRSLVDYNRAIMRLHFAKGSLLEFNGVYLAEGPWPGKAYFDALRRARQRDASLFLDYGWTRPDVISRGPVPQVSGASTGAGLPGPVPTEAPNGTSAPENTTPLVPGAPVESIPTPISEPVSLSSRGPLNMVEFVQPLPAVAESAAAATPAGPPAASSPTVVPAPRLAPARRAFPPILF